MSAEDARRLLAADALASSLALLRGYLSSLSHLLDLQAGGIHNPDRVEPDLDIFNEAAFLGAVSTLRWGPLACFQLIKI